MFLFLGVLLATIIAYVLRFHYEFLHAFYLSLKMTGPPAYPLIGNGLLFMNKSSAGINVEFNDNGSAVSFADHKSYPSFLVSISSTQRTSIKS